MNYIVVYVLDGGVLWWRGVRRDRAVPRQSSLRHISSSESDTARRSLSSRLGFSSPAHALLGPLLGQPLAVWPMGLGRSSPVGRGRGNQWVDAKPKHMMLWTQRKLTS
jgi:hypothetical protein